MCPFVLNKVRRAAMRGSHSRYHLGSCAGSLIWSALTIILLPLASQWRNPGGQSDWWGIILALVIAAIVWSLSAMRAVWNDGVLARLPLLVCLCIEFGALCMLAIYRLH